jgi:hypothetical protein
MGDFQDTPAAVVRELLGAHSPLHFAGEGDGGGFLGVGLEETVFNGVWAEPEVGSLPLGLRGRGPQDFPAEGPPGGGGVPFGAVEELHRFDPS